MTAITVPAREGRAIQVKAGEHLRITTPKGAQAADFFANTRVEPDGRFVSPPNPVPPGAFIEMKALMDLICVVSSCPFDLNVEGWTINAGQRPTELLVEVR